MAGRLYEPLSHKVAVHGLSRRRFIFIVVGFFVLLCVLYTRPFSVPVPDVPPKPALDLSDLIPNNHSSQINDPLEFPPSYEQLIQWQHDLPQHNLDLPFPEGKNGRYVKFSNQIKMLGWNNVLNEVLMNAHLAYESKRSYVFQDYYWKPDYYYWPESKFREYPPRTPLNAIISGPAAGGPWDENDNAPRSIHESWFDVVCPVDERRLINTRDVKPAIQDKDGDEIFAHWKNILLNAQERCIEIVPAPYEEDNFSQTFDLWFFGGIKSISMWDSFSKSPTSRLLASSPIVNSAVDRNEYLFHPRGPRPPHPASRNPYDRMLAIHIRRGDFREACVRLAKWNSTFYNWNLLPFLPDAFTPPPGGAWGENTPGNVERYMEHCLPDLDAMMKKIHDSRADYVRAAKGARPTLDVIYMLTNEKGEWLDHMKDALRSDGWYTIATSKDLVLDAEQVDVNMAIDMDIARRAAVFIGNGWSSFTSNIVHRRLVDGKEPISTRFY